MIAVKGINRLASESNYTIETLSFSFNISIKIFRVYLTNFIFWPCIDPLLSITHIKSREGLEFTYKPLNKILNRLEMIVSVKNKYIILIYYQKLLLFNKK